MVTRLIERRERSRREGRRRYIDRALGGAPGRARRKVGSPRWIAGPFVAPAAFTNCRPPTKTSPHQSRRVAAEFPPRPRSKDGERTPSGHVLRSVLRRQRELHRVGHDRLSGVKFRYRPTIAYSQPPARVHRSAYDYMFTKASAAPSPGRRTPWRLDSRTRTWRSSASARRAAAVLPSRRRADVIGLGRQLDDREGLLPDRLE